MTRRALLLFLPAALLLPTTAAATTPGVTARRIVASGMPGAVVLVKNRTGTHVGVAGFADVARKRPMTPAVSFRVGSITKTFVSALVMQLAQRRQLRLEDTVERWLPGLVPNGRAITLRQLLNHTSGLYDYSEDPRLESTLYGSYTRWAPSQLVAIGASHAPLFAPATGWGYSNTNYLVLGLVVQAVTHKRAEAQLARALLKPLRLQRTALPTTPRLPAPFARGYLLAGAKGASPDRALTDVTGVGAAWAWTAGGAVSTTGDVARFYTALLRGRIVTQTFLRAMLQPVSIDAYGNGYGLGLSLSRLGCGVSWGHNGSVPGYTTYVLNSPSADRQVVAFVNGIPGGATQRAAVDNAVVDAFCSN